MRCPYCNEEMICGSVQSQREIFFTTKPDKNWLIPSINKKDEIILVLIIGRNQPVWHIIALPAGKLLLIIQLKVNRS